MNDTTTAIDIEDWLSADQPPQDDDVLYRYYAEDYGPFYDDDEIRTTMYTSRPPALLSLLGSLFIIYDILKHSWLGTGCNKVWKRITCGKSLASRVGCGRSGTTTTTTAMQRNRGGGRRRGTANANNNHQIVLAHKIMLGLSVCDAITSSVYILGTTPVPKGQVVGAQGNKLTCTLQGFSIMYALPTGRMYNAVLAICYVLVVRYNWKEDQFRKVQYFFLLFPHVFGLLVAIPLLVDKGYNFDGQHMCGPSTYPAWCNRTATYDETDFDEERPPCIRGGTLTVGGAKLGTIGAMIMIPLDIVLSGIIIIFCMILLYCTVRSRERRNEQYDFELRQSRQNSSTGGSRTAISRTGTTTTTSSLMDDDGATVPARGIIQRGLDCCCFRRGGRQRPSSTQESQHGSSLTSSRHSSSATTNRNTVSSSSSSRATRRQSTIVAMQGMLYSAAYWMTMGPWLIMFIWWLGPFPKRRPQWIKTCGMVFVTSQGLVNALVYLRPRIMTWCFERKRRHRHHHQQQQRNQQRQQSQRRRIEAGGCGGGSSSGTTFGGGSSTGGGIGTTGSGKASISKSYHHPQENSCTEYQLEGGDEAVSAFLSAAFTAPAPAPRTSANSSSAAPAIKTPTSTQNKDNKTTTGGGGSNKSRDGDDDTHNSKHQKVVAAAATATATTTIKQNEEAEGSCSSLPPLKSGDRNNPLEEEKMEVSATGCDAALSVRDERKEQDFPQERNSSWNWNNELPPVSSQVQPSPPKNNWQIQARNERSVRVEEHPEEDDKANHPKSGGEAATSTEEATTTTNKQNVATIPNALSLEADVQHGDTNNSNNNNNNIIMKMDDEEERNEEDEEEARQEAAAEEDEKEVKTTRIDMAAIVHSESTGTLEV